MELSPSQNVGMKVGLEECTQHVGTGEMDLHAVE